MKYFLIFSVFLFAGLGLYAQVPIDEKRQQEYVNSNSFRTAKYTDENIPLFEESRQLLPQPIFDEDFGYVEMYWKVWEMSFSRFRKPALGSPFISNYIDEAFNEGLFMWDTAFMTMFCNYAWKLVPGIQSLNNFYFTQMDDGEIVREIDEITGEPRSYWAKPGTPASLNHPILGWAELRSFRLTNDTARLHKVFAPLAAHYYSYNKIKDPITGLFYGSWASMDNSPRIEGMLCSIDTSAEVVLLAKNLAYIASILGLKEESLRFESEAKAVSDIINKYLWCNRTDFYYDLNTDRKIHNIKTIAAYWTLLASIADREQAEALVAKLNDPSEFGRLHMVPTVPASEPTFEPEGQYWRGGVWTPTTVMVVEGLKQYGYNTLADKVALNHLENVYKVYKKTGTVWEFYQPDRSEPGVLDGYSTRFDFTGWTACAPISLFIESKIGLDIDAPRNTITWSLTTNQRVGLGNISFGSNNVDLIAEAENEDGKRKIRIKAEEPFQLIIIKKGVLNRYDVGGGNTDILL